MIIAEPEIDLDDELKKLGVSLSQEAPQNLNKIFLQLNQIVAGTHFAVPIQEPELKKKTKGRPALKQDQLTLTKRNPAAFEVVEEKLKKDAITKKRALAAATIQSSKRFKKSSSSKDDSDYKGSEVGSGEDDETVIRASDCERESASYVETKIVGTKTEIVGTETEIVGTETKIVDTEEMVDVEKKVIVSASKRDGGFMISIEADLYHASQIPQSMKQYVKEVFDPSADGNCSF
ncbi:hypothetical protein PCASD_15646 [Puccinia coronata f. sp. avenae]|uniref:Uncharacterized protein n=1 Tax=Puccinia coronata f. sp. avenae TaxID=200324 RepID=A0A2N5U221_9BASI|nr:hypothetical protein PCASD_15646 [Puccinia coronata f. sp. avenae]